MAVSIMINPLTGGGLLATAQQSPVLQGLAERLASL